MALATTLGTGEFPLLTNESNSFVSNQKVGPCNMQCVYKMRERHFVKPLRWLI